MIPNWPIEQIGEIVELKYGKGLPKQERKSNGKYPIFGANGELGRTNRYLVEGEAIIVGRKGSAGEVTRVSGRFWPSDVSYYVLGNENIDIDYLFHLFKSLRLQRFAVGVKPGINRNKIYEIQIPLPPLAEQKKIVAKLEKVFAKIKEAKRLRAEAQEATKTLLSAELHKIFSEGKTKGWEEKNIGETCELFQGLAINKKTKHLLVDKSSLPLLRIKDLRDDSEEQYVAEVGYPKGALVSEEDILYTRTGQIGLVFKGRKGVLHNNCFKVVPNSSLDNNFLYWFLQEPAFKSVIIGLSSRTAQPDITHKNFKAQKIFIPPLAEQKKIVARLDSLSDKIKKLQDHQESTRLDLEKLEQSFLVKAFSGELM